MKKIFCVMVALISLLAFASCGKEEKVSSGAESVDAPSASTTNAPKDENNDIETEKEIEENTTKEPSKQATDSEDEDFSEDKVTNKVTTTKANTQTKAPTISSNGKENGVLTVSGKSVYVGMSVSKSFINSLGTPIDVQNAPSCHYDGNDTIYIFNGYSIYTYRSGNQDVVYLMEITDSSVKTAKGATVGMTVDKIESIYGTPSSKTPAMLKYSTPKGTIDFTCAGNVVTLIEYCE